MGEQVAGEVHPAPLVAGALEGPLQGLHEPGVLVADDEPDAVQAALLQGGQEAAPERLVLAVADVESEDLAGAVGGDPGGDDDGHRDDLGGWLRTLR